MAIELYITRFFGIGEALSLGAYWILFFLSEGVFVRGEF